MAGINITQGTQTNIATDAIGTVNYQIVKLDRGAAGASSLFTGTLDSLTALAKGTISTGTVSITTGTLNGGTLSNLNFGTVDLFYRHPDAFATTVFTGTNTLGTIKPLVSGSAIYVTDLIISVGSATNVEIASGGTSTGILGTLFLSQYGGAVMNFVTPLRTAAGSALVYKQSVGCPMSITCMGYVD